MAATPRARCSLSRSLPSSDLGDNTLVHKKIKSSEPTFTLPTLESVQHSLHATRNYPTGFSHSSIESWLTGTGNSKADEVIVSLAGFLAQAGRQATIDATDGRPSSAGTTERLSGMSSRSCDQSSDPVTPPSAVADVPAAHCDERNPLHSVSFVERLSGITEDSGNTVNCSKPEYEGVLNDNRVHMLDYTEKPPLHVADFAMGILNRKREMASAEELMNMRTDLSEARRNEEARIKRISLNKLFPSERRHLSDNVSNSIAFGEDMLFNRSALPWVPGTDGSTVSTPKPDFHYGYSGRLIKQLGHGYTRILSDPRMAHFAKPNAISYFPFLSVEFKAGTRNGHLMVAEKQNAGTGAHTVNCVRRLLTVSDPTSQLDVTDSLAFSIVADGRYHNIWIHWFDPTYGPFANGDVGGFMSAEVATYDFKDLERVAPFWCSIRNILDWGTNERFEIIKQATERLVSVWPASIRVLPLSTTKIIKGNGSPESASVMESDLSQQLHKVKTGKIGKRPLQKMLQQILTAMINQQQASTPNDPLDSETKRCV